MSPTDQARLQPLIRRARPLLTLLLLLAPLLVSGCAATGGNDIFEAGLKKAEAGDVNGAIDTLSEGAQQFPGNVPMRFELARLQYEVGESYHVKERKAIRDAARFLEQPDGRDEALANQRKANELRAKATPYYQAARDNLDYVRDHEGDDHRNGWANLLLMRVNLFFADYEAAAENMQRAIELMKPTGPQLSQWREFQAGIREKVTKRLSY